MRVREEGWRHRLMVRGGGVRGEGYKLEVGDSVKDVWDSDSSNNIVCLDEASFHQLQSVNSFVTLSVFAPVHQVLSSKHSFSV